MGREAARVTKIPTRNPPEPPTQYTHAAPAHTDPPRVGGPVWVAVAQCGRWWGCVYCVGALELAVPSTWAKAVA